MFKTKLIYLVTMLIFAIGLWLILRVGAGLHAARNVAGEWTLTGAGGASGQLDRLTVNQSGRFLTGTLRGPSTRIPFRGELVDISKLSLTSSQPQLTITATLNDDGDALAGRLDGVFSGDLLATRLSAGPSVTR